jgi:histidyl-tRNA synthetase
VPELDAFVVVTDEPLRGQARMLTSALRSATFRVDMTDTQRSVKAQFKEADRRGARAVIVVGSEWADGNVTVKNLDTGDQNVITAKEIKAWLQDQ